MRTVVKMGQGEEGKIFARRKGSFWLQAKKRKDHIESKPKGRGGA